MKRSTIVLLVMVVIAGLMFVWGCSDDDDDAIGPILANPDPADSTFMTDLFDDGVFMTALHSLEVSLALLESLPGAPVVKGMDGVKALGAAQEDIVITAIIDYEYTNGWHIFDFEAMVVDEFESDTTDVVGIDSIRLVMDGSPVQYPGNLDSLDGLSEHAHVTWAMRDVVDPDSGFINHLVDLEQLVALTDTILKLDGSVRDTMRVREDVETATCEIDMTLSETITNLQIDVNAPEGDCPETGTINVTATLDIECQGDQGSQFDSLSISGTWTVNATVNPNNTVTISFSDGLVAWTVTETCGGD